MPWKPSLAHIKMFNDVSYPIKVGHLASKTKWYLIRAGPTSAIVEVLFLSQIGLQPNLLVKVTPPRLENTPSIYLFLSSK
jgi:hypothetical protein